MFRLFGKSIHESERLQHADVEQYSTMFSEQILSGESCAQVNGGYGVFGSVTNPMPVDGVLGEIRYHVKLRGLTASERLCIGVVAIEPVTSVVEQLLNHDDEPYLAVVVHADTLQCHLQQLLEYLGDSDYVRYTANQQLRDRGEHHITVVSPAEFEQLIKSGMAVSATNQSMQYRMVGLGRTLLGGDTAYYVVCESEGLQQFRASLRLGRKGFHITLGFEEADVHEVVKDASTLIDPLAGMTQ